MKKRLLKLAGLFLLGTNIAVAQQQPNNPGFESWESAGGGMDPLHWSDMKTGNLCFFCEFGSSKRVFQDTDAHSGTYSARIESTSASGITVNGNMTMGQVNAPSTTPTEGYNKTVRSNDDFHQDFTGLPDSVVFWAKYNKTDASDSARATFVLHGDYDVREPNDGGSTPYIVAKAVKNFQTGGTSQWVRVSIPFDYASWPAAPGSNVYILGTFTSSYVPGSGSSTSKLWVDDLEYIYNPPTANFDPVADVCGFNPVQFTNTTISTNNTTTYNWDFGDGATSTDEHPIHSYLTDGNYMVTLTATNVGGSTTHSFPVIVHPQNGAFASANGPTLLCPGQTTELSVSATNPSTYLWSNGETTETITVSTPDNYSVTVTDANGCTALSNDITVSPVLVTEPTITANGPTTFCQGETVTLTSSSAQSYSWSSGETSQSITVSSSDVVSVTVVDLSGCNVSSSPTTVTVNPAPSITLGTISSPSTCGNNDGSIVVDGTGTGDISWTGNSSGTESSQSLPYTITGLAAGTYNVTYTENGCPATISGTVNDPSAPAQPTVTVGGSTDLCPGETVMLTSSPATSYLWSNGETTQSISVSAADNYSVTITNGSGCSASSTSTTVNVNTVTTPTISAGGSTELCPGGSVDLTSSTGITYLWSTGETTPSINVNSTDDYSVTTTDANGCTATSAITTVTVNALPIAVASPGATVCQNTGDFNVIITGNGNGPFSFDYNIDGGASQNVTSVGSDASVVISTANTGTSTINFTNVTDVNSCSQSLSQSTTIVVNPLPTATITGAATVCVGDAEPQVMITGANATAPYNFTYNIDGGSNQVVTSTGNIATINAPTTTAGSFTYNLVSVQDGSTAQCEQVQIGSVTVDVVATPTVTLDDFSTDTICVNASPIALPAGSPVSGTYSGNGVSGANFDPAAAGIGTHTITYEFGTAACVGTATTTIVVDGCSSIEENTMTAFSMVPNPATENVTINLNNDINGTIAIIDLSGKVVYNSAINGLKNTISVSNLNKGMYFVQVTDENGNQSGEKLMVK